MIVCVFFKFQQITGINVPLYYGPTILSGFFRSGHNAVNAAVAGVEVTAILGAVNVVATARDSDSGGVMVCCAVLCVAAIAFVYRFLPETKDCRSRGPCTSSSARPPDRDRRRGRLGPR
ncbi:MAG: MFS transporter [Streptosporangiaceae bacterium]